MRPKRAGTLNQAAIRRRLCQQIPKPNRSNRPYLVRTIQGLERERELTTRLLVAWQAEQQHARPRGTLPATQVRVLDVRRRPTVFKRTEPLQEMLRHYLKNHIELGVRLEVLGGWLAKAKKGRGK